MHWIHYQGSIAKLDDKKLLSGMDAIGWNLKKKKKRIHSQT